VKIAAEQETSIVEGAMTLIAEKIPVVPVF
jgi:hypothetical protein